MTHGDLRVTSGGKLLPVGNVAGTLAVESGGYAYLVGMMERLVVAPGAKAKLRGWCKGDAVNEGGDLEILRGAVIEGALHGRAATRVHPQTRIGS